MAVYEKLFAVHGLAVAQISFDHADLEHHERHLNARNTLIRPAAPRSSPIINENDVVSFTELKFGDNDKLSALVASLLPADLLVILTTVDGGDQKTTASPMQKVVPTIERIDAAWRKWREARIVPRAVGGMSSKVEAAKIAVRSGIPLVIASGRNKHTLERVMNGEAEGTLFKPHSTGLKGRKRWIAFFHHPKGALFVDAGARKALRENGKSLLPARNHAV
jgi:glutamate 5-kinase